MKQEFPNNFKEYLLTEISREEKLAKAYEDGLNRELFKTTDSVDFIAKQLGWEKRPANVSDAEKKLEIQRRPGQTRQRSKKEFYKEGSFEERVKKVGKRDPNVRKEKLASYGDNPVYCDVCGFYPLNEKFQAIYPYLNQQNYLSMFDVHHIRGIKEGERITDPINDTMVVCGNCHELADQS